MEKDTLHQKHSSKYASFLLKYHLEDLIKYTCEPAEGTIAPPCNQLNEPAISISKKRSIQYLLNQLAEGKTLENLKNNQKRNVKIKSEMIKLVSEFTKDVEIAKSIFLDLEEIFIYNEIVDINNVILENKEIESKLKETKTELQNTKAELLQLLQLLKKNENNTSKNPLTFDLKNPSFTKTTNDLDDFICAASHELKAPIANIEGLATCLNQKTNKEDEDTRFMAGLISISILKYKETIKDLCDIPYLQKASNEEIELIELKSLVEDIKSNVLKNVPGFTTLIETNFSKYPFIRFSIKNLSRIITYLIANTLKYNSLNNQPEIFIKTEGVDGYILLSIKHKGVSIHTNDNPLSQKLDDHIEGSGIDLYIVKRIIEQEGGKIEIKSQDNKNLEFKIYLKN